SGTLKKDDTLHASKARKGVKISQLFRVQANHTEPVEAAGQGDIVAVAKAEDLHTGSSLGDLELPAIQFPTPMAGLAVTPKSRGDEGKLSTALHKIVEEDLTLHLDRDAQTKELVMTGMSELHLQIIRERLKRRDKVEVDVKEPKIPYRETVQANHTEPVDVAGPGDIVAVAKAEDLHTGTSLGDLELPPINFPTPMAGLAVTPKSRGDEGKLSTALHKIVEEDLTLHLDRDAQTKELVMTGMSELHLQIIRERLKRRDKVEVDVKEPKIPYRETVQNKAEGSYRHKKQSGGRGQFGEVHIRMFPLPLGTNIEEFATKANFSSMREYHYDPKNNFLWVDSIVGGTIPNNFLPAVEKGFKERMERGVIAGYKVQNIGVEVHFGKHHPVDSSEAAFKTAGSMAFRNVFQQAKPGLLEPIVTMHITVPSEKLGDINSDMSGRRGRVLGMDSAGGDLQTVTAEVQLAEVTTYARALSSMTGGQGSFTMEFNRYEVVPGNVQKDIIEKAVLHPEEEE
ncbi:MAG: hypothetical protein ACREHD_14335, partial [Pirellulales bacterium]